MGGASHNHNNIRFPLSSTARERATTQNQLKSMGTLGHGAGTIGCRGRVIFGVLGAVLRSVESLAACHICGAGGGGASGSAAKPACIAFYPFFPERCGSQRMKHRPGPQGLPKYEITKRDRGEEGGFGGGSHTGRSSGQLWFAGSAWSSSLFSFFSRNLTLKLPARPAAEMSVQSGELHAPPPPTTHPLDWHTT